MYASKRWHEPIDKISFDIDDPILITKQELNDINRVYRFEYIPKIGLYYDKKWNKTVAKEVKNRITDDISIYFSKSWIKNELFRTGTSLLLKFCYNNAQCLDIYNKYKEKKYLEAMEFREQNKEWFKNAIKQDDTE